MPRTRLSARTRREVLNRDGNKCRLCGAGGPHEIHHDAAVFWHDIDPVRFPLTRIDDLSNLWTLCIECHAAQTKAQAKVRARMRRRTQQKKQDKQKRKWPSRPFPKRRDQHGRGGRVRISGRGGHAAGTAAGSGGSGGEEDGDP